MSGPRLACSSCFWGHGIKSSTLVEDTWHPNLSKNDRSQESGGSLGVSGPESKYDQVSPGDVCAAGASDMFCMTHGLICMARRQLEFS